MQQVVLFHQGRMSYFPLIWTTNIFMDAKAKEIYGNGYSKYWSEYKGSLVTVNLCRSSEVVLVC